MSQTGANSGRNLSNGENGMASSCCANISDILTIARGGENMDDEGNGEEKQQ